MEIKNTLIQVAHRGLQPENTLFAFKKAYEAGFLVAECDVQATKDCQMIVCHDDTLRRTATKNSALLDVPIANLSYTDLQAIKVGSEQHSERVPLLKQLLPIVPQGNYLLLEIKFKDSRFLSALISCITLYLDKVIVTSFCSMMLTALKQKLPQCKTILLTTAVKDMPTGLMVNSKDSLAEALLLLKEANLDGLGFEYSDFITKENLALLPAGLLTQLWYNERLPERVSEILAIARQAGVQLVNVDF